MAGFLKVLLRNVLDGPSTDPFPLGETFTPDRFRGKVLINPELCMGCGICHHTCAAGAINITVRKDNSGYDFTVWHNSCCLCASCRHYCPTKAITLTTDWHNAHGQDEKFTWMEHKFIPYVPCETCGTPMRRLPMDVAKRIYVNNPDVEIEHIVKLCPQCRQMEDAMRTAAIVAKAEADAAAAAEESAKAAEAAPAAEAPKAPAPAPAPAPEVKEAEAARETNAEAPAPAEAPKQAKAPEAAAPQSVEAAPKAEAAPKVEAAPAQEAPKAPAAAETVTKPAAKPASKPAKAAPKGKKAAAKGKK